VIVDTFPISAGRTNCQFRYDLKTEKPNCFVAERMNVDRFWEIMLASYEKCVPIK
jgi:inosine-uridine nucleoside N-ribohydrolase